MGALPMVYALQQQHEYIIMVLGIMVSSILVPQFYKVSMALSMYAISTRMDLQRLASSSMTVIQMLYKHCK